MYDINDHRPDSDGRCIECRTFHLCLWCRKEVHPGLCTQRVYFWTDPDGEVHSRTVDLQGLQGDGKNLSPRGASNQQRKEYVMTSKSEASLVSFSSTWESLMTILDGFFSELLDHLIAPVAVSKDQSFAVRNAERFAISNSIDQSIPAVWVESELAGNAGEVFHAFCETPKMVGDPDSEFAENRDPLDYDAIWLKAGVNPFARDGELEDVITVTVIGKGPRYVRTDRVIGEAVNFLTSPDAQATYEYELDEEAVVFETVGFIPVDQTSAVNFDGPARFMSALQSQVRQTRKASPSDAARDFSNIEQDNEVSQITRYAAGRN